ncbi:MAG: F0F1 ATP synthase subunit A [Acidobacteriota bacterium]
MPEHELWLTHLFNDHLAGEANTVLAWFGLQAANPARPWPNFITMQILVAALIVAVFAILRRQLSMDRPGKLQHCFEIIYTFLRGQADEVVGHGGRPHVPFFGTIFLFILFSNLLGLIPGLESPTMFPYVPAGCAMAAFCYYHYAGIRAQGLGKYLAHFAGPVPLMAPIMIPIEMVSHLGRPLSLTVRLFANMYASEQITIVFISLTYLVVPAIFMGLHVFVAFLQAYVFSLLTMVYVGGAVAHEEH